MINVPAWEDIAVTPTARRRATVVLFCFVFWSIVVVTRLAQYMIVQRDHYLRQMSRESVVHGRVPSRRGRIVNRDGRVLAWSERRASAKWRVPADASLALAHRAQLVSVLDTPCLPGEGALRGLAGTWVPLSTDLTAKQFVALSNLSLSRSELILRTSFIRRRCQASQRILQIIGEVREEQGELHGASGLERANDALLCGHSGIFEVMMDRRGKWMLETWRELHPMKPGYDVRLPLRIDGSESGTSQ
ncbi:MAG: hypothetical protein KAI66_26765 [Lentisphaeria bacterium]|nr:hypothetical protein [Lentisphaeria bacterium]